MSSRTIMKGSGGKKTKLCGIPSSIEISALGHGYAGTTKCLIVNMSHFKYMFNCGEGTQCLASEHRKLRGTNRVFITSGAWSNVGGLIGLSLTLETAEIQKLSMYGPQDVMNHVTTSRGFSKLEKIQIVSEDMSVGSMTDTAMTIDFIKIKPQTKYNSSPKRMKMSTDADAVAYLCKPHAKPRNVDFQKCIELKIPPGPHLALLKEEKEIILPGTDRVIKPDDILSAQEPSDPFLIVECPTADHLQSLVSSPEILKFQDENSKLSLVVHFTHSSVMKDPEYVQWMENFGASTRHMVLNDLCSSLDKEASQRVQAPRNLIHPEIFPLLPHSLYPEDHFINKKDQIVIKNGETNLVCYAKTNTRYIYRPITDEPFTDDQCIVIDTKKYVEEALKKPSTKEFIDDWQKNLEVIEKSPPTLDDPEVVFLGTGSAVPNKYRNVSCIAIHVGDESSILLDCGENSCGQLYRFYGDATRDKLKKLKAIFISHLHADHHLGLIGIATQRQKILEECGDDAEPLIVIAPTPLKKWFATITCDDIPIDRIINFLPSEYLQNENPPDIPPYHKLLKSFGFNKVRTIRVQHKQCPYGIVLQHERGWSIVYSGDTKPCEDLVRVGKGCDLLIHEATFDNHKVEEAMEKSHSTTDQAIEVGRKMEARFTMLTHFSQRYDKVPLFSDMFSDDVGVAFDNMKVKLSELRHLPKFVPAYKLIHEEEYQEMLESVENKQFRTELAKGTNMN